MKLRDELYTNFSYAKNKINHLCINPYKFAIDPSSHRSFATQLH